MKISDTPKVLRKRMLRPGSYHGALKHFVALSLFAFFCRLSVSVLPAQWDYDVTLTGYPNAKWKALTSYIDKPTMGDVTGDASPK
jgi:hypothetical protein